MKTSILAVLVLLPFTSFCTNRQVTGTDEVAEYITGLFDQNKNEQERETRPQTVKQQVVIPPVPAEASFAGEPVPLKYFDVREALQREITVITYWHGSLSYIIQLAGRYQARPTQKDTGNF